MSKIYELKLKGRKMRLFIMGIASLLLTGTLFASADVDAKVIAFEKQRLMANQGIEVKSVTITTKKTLPIKGWYGYVLNIEANVPGRGMVNGADMLFSNGETIAPELININNSSSYKDLLLPTVGEAYYKKDHLIAGNEDAKNKVVVFSDPLCPACQGSLPGFIKKALDKPADIALYYYHFPLLQLHPAADTVSKAMVVAKKKGFKNIEQKIYGTDFSPYFAATETDTKKILDGFNKIFNLDIKIEELDGGKDEVARDFKMGQDVMVQGTPTLFVNGVVDKSRRLFGAL